MDHLWFQQGPQYILVGPKVFAMLKRAIAKSKRRDPHAKARAAMIKAHSTPNALLGRLKP